MTPTILLIAVFCYIFTLFAIARFGDRQHFVEKSWVRHPLIYALALGVYCTSWTFYGLVGTASEKGWNFLPILLGPALLFTLGYPLVERIYKLCRQEHIHSIADFLSSRYGKRQGVATTISLVVLLATIPYIALQLKAVSDSLRLALGPDFLVSQDLTLVIGFAMIAFTLVFGAKRLDMSGYHSGLMLAIAFESLIKILVLMIMAIMALVWIMDFDALQLATESAAKTNSPQSLSTQVSVFYQSIVWPRFLVETLLSACAVFCLPRMFHISFVECLSPKHLRRSRWVFFAYLAFISVFIVVIASAGNLLFAGQGVEGDAYMIALPLEKAGQWLTVFAFIGGFSAATAMVIVATITLSYMISNEVVLPFLIQRKNKKSNSTFSRSLIFARRLVVVCIVLGAYLYQSLLAENIQLTSIGLVAFALIAQLAPGVLFGLYWRKGNAAGLYAGLIVGLILWFYTFMVPLLAAEGLLSQRLVDNGLLGIYWLRPESLFNLSFSDSFTRSVIISLSANVIFYCWYSLSSVETLTDKVQADAFTRLEKGQYHHYENINLSDLAVLLEEFLGQKNTESLLATYQPQGDNKIDKIEKRKLIEKTQQALASVVGVASSQAMIETLYSGKKIAVEEVVNLFGYANKALQFNRDVLSASFENISSGISVVDKDLRLTAWNQRYEEMFKYPKGMLYVGLPVAEMILFNAKRGFMGEGTAEDQVNKRLSLMNQGKSYRVVRQHSEDKIIEIKGQPMPSGGYVTSYDDITEFIKVQKNLEDINAHLEERVQERTQTIATVNDNLVSEIQRRGEVEEQLRQAKEMADAANASKTKFLALASHDIMQPLNAAHLYADTLLSSDHNHIDNKPIARQLKSAIENTESIISSLLEISKVDSNRLTPNKQTFSLDSLLDSIVNECRVQCPEGLTLRYVKTSLWVHSDPQYLRRIVQNFLTNAIKYTQRGKVLIGCRRILSHKQPPELKICILDNGVGIAEHEKNQIFDDFYRIDYPSKNHKLPDQDVLPGVGLGLAVVLRFAELLNHPILCESELGKGSCFSVTVPIAPAPEVKPALTSQAVGAMSANTMLANLSVVYVDDDQENLAAIKALLSRWGCEVNVMNSIDKAIAYLNTDNPTPDVLLMDYQLDQSAKTGIELAEQMQTFWQEHDHDLSSNSPMVCIVSAATELGLASAAKEKQFHFLPKPLNAGRLRALLMQVRSNNV